MTAAGAIRKIDCPSCGGSIGIKAAGYTVSLACHYCGSLLDVASPDVKLVSQYHQAVHDLTIPLGRRGTIDGTIWEVIGYLERSDDETSWSEYLLFNPYAGYRWLIDADGEWTLGSAVTSPPNSYGSFGTRWNFRQYSRAYDPVTVTTDYVLGEFYWRVKAGDTAQSSFFEGEQDSLSLEQSATETNWTQISPLPAGFVETTFGLDRPTRAAVGQAPTAKTTTGLLTQMFKIGGIATVALFLLSMIFGMTGKSASREFTVYAGQAPQTVTVGTMTITRPYQSVTIKAQSSSFTNKWVDLDYSLVNRATQESVDVYGLVEYYEGTDSDGRWTEGSHTTTLKLAGIPKGTYDLAVEASAHDWNGGSSSSWFGSDPPPAAGSGSGDPITLKVSFAPGGTFGGNLILFSLLIFGPPFWLLYRRIKGRREDFYDDD